MLQSLSNMNILSQSFHIKLAIVTTEVLDMTTSKGECDPESKEIQWNSEGPFYSVGY